MKQLLALLAFAPFPVHASSCDVGNAVLTVVHPVLSFLFYAVLGIITAIVGYRMFDKYTPGDLHKEIIENRNSAAAIIGASVILGVSIIVAAAIAG